MSESIKRKLNFKRIVGVVVPILIMALACGIVGYSFAWFSDATDTEIATINFSTAKVFTLTFDLGAARGNNSYHGQTAILGSSMNANAQFPIGADGGHLVTTDWANYLNISGTSAAAQEQYLQDQPFSFATNIILDTEEEAIDLDISITNVLIEFRKHSDPEDDTSEMIPDPARASSTITIPKDANGDGDYADAGDYSLNDIAYGFTWYMEKADGTKYTPYGTPYSTASGAVGNALTSANPKWTASTPVKQNIQNFTAAREAFVFYIVFVPEKLYWLKDSTYSDAGTLDWHKTVSNVYSSAERSSAGWSYARSYISQTYQGATFSFTVTMERTDMEG